MSTFGKKALSNWDYTHTKENTMRFNKTPLELQLKILEKWYPIGTVCYKWNWITKKYEGDKIIQEYVLMIGDYYNIETAKDVILVDQKYKMKETYHPLQLHPKPNELQRILRDEKLKRLGI